MALDTGLQSYWKCDETSGTLVSDAHGNVDGTLTGSFTTGKINNGVYCGAADNHGVFFTGNDFSYDIDDAFSFSFWMYMSSANALYVGGLINKLGSSGGGYRIMYQGSENSQFRILYSQFITSSGRIEVETNTTLPFTGWHYVTVTYDGSQVGNGVKFYYDGVLTSTVVTISAATGSMINTQPFTIGNTGFNLNMLEFKGKLDEIGAWDRVLTAEEISDLYNGGNGLSYNEIINLPYPPTGLTISNITYSGVTLNWVNNNTSGVTGNYIQEYSGGAWVTVATVSSGATSYNVTGLTPATQYTYRVAVYNNTYTSPSAAVNFKTSYDVGKNLVAYFKCDEVSGSTTIVDSINGVIATGTTANTVTNGKINNGITFTGSTNSRFNTPVGEYAFEGNQPYSISMWVKQNSFYDGITPVVERQLYCNFNYVGGKTFGYDCFLTGDNVIYCRMYFANGGYQSSVQTFTSAPVMQSTNWYLVVVTYDGTVSVDSIKLYINAAQPSVSHAGTPTGGTASNNNILNIGNYRIGSTALRNFIGKLDEIGIWDRVLTQDDIDTIYNGGNGLQYPFQNEPIITTTSSITCTGATLNWINSNPSIMVSNYIQLWNGSTWVTIATVSSGATSYNITGLSPLLTYTYRVTAYDGTNTYPSLGVNLTTLDPTPFNLNAVVNYQDAAFTWSINDSGYGTAIRPEIRVLGSSIWITKPNLAKNATSYTFTGLAWSTDYEVRFVRIGSEYPSQIYNISIEDFIYPIPFCDGTNYLVTGSTCGNGDGRIELNDYLYVVVYDFILNDIDGNTYSITDYYWTGLTASWYTITATPKPAFESYYGNQPCTLNWIPINDTDTSMSLTSVSIRPVQCQPFDIQYGRIYYNVSGATYAHTYTFSIYTPDKVLYYQLTGITNSNNFVVNNSPAQCYYGVITDETNGCHLLLGYNCVDSKPLFSLGGIKKIWIAKWNDDLEYNYWSTADDDYFLEFDDTSFFTSTKIKEYKSISGGTIQWYSLPVMDKIVKLDQKLEKVRQGFIFTDTLTLAISNANASKWTTFQTLMNPDNKWVYVCIDDNNQAWTGGYRHGGRINTYRFASGGRDEDNGYQFVITAESENKILTAIDNNYIINNII
jgi:hypothetical protein